MDLHSRPTNLNLNSLEPPVVNLGIKIEGHERDEGDQDSVHIEIIDEEFLDIVNLVTSDHHSDETTAIAKATVTKLATAFIKLVRKVQTLENQVASCLQTIPLVYEAMGKCNVLEECIKTFKEDVEVQLAEVAVFSQFSVPRQEQDPTHHHQQGARSPTLPPGNMLTPASDKLSIGVLQSLPPQVEDSRLNQNVANQNQDVLPQSNDYDRDEHHYRHQKYQCKVCPGSATTTFDKPEGLAQHYTRHHSAAITRRAQEKLEGEMGMDEADEEEDPNTRDPLALADDPVSNLNQCDERISSDFLFAQSGEHEKMLRKEVDTEFNLSNEGVGQRGHNSQSQQVETGTGAGLDSEQGSSTGRKVWKKCQICHKTFVDLPKHMKTHPKGKEKRFKCSFCDLAFNQSCNLKTHERTHTGERPFKCKMCGHGFSQRSGLHQHERTHTGERPFKCKICGRGFSQWSTLHNHELIHSDERPFKCKICDLSFKLRGNLKAHELTHISEHPYKCQYCSKTFPSPLSRQIHEKIHTDGLPHRCQMCDKSFRSPSRLKADALKNHKQT